MKIGTYELDAVYNEDCLEALSKLPDKSVDLILTDPPYFIGFNSSAKEGGRQDWGSHTMLVPLFERLYGEFRRILKPTGRVLMFTDWRTYPTLYLAASKFIRVSNMICWDFGWIKAGTQFRFTHELIVHCTMPEAKSPKNRSTSDVWRVKPVNFTAERFHPAEKPVEIMRMAIEETTERGDVVLDCFVGGGSCMIAAKSIGRHYLGFEINEDYVKVTNDRLKEVQEQTNIDDRPLEGLEAWTQ